MVSLESQRKVCKGEYAHYSDASNKTPRFRGADGTIAQNNVENANIIIPHFEKIYNNQKSVDFEFVNKHLKQFPVELDLDENLDFDEFNEVLGQIANGKTGGENEVPLKLSKPQMTNTMRDYTNLPTISLMVTKTLTAGTEDY